MTVQQQIEFEALKLTVIEQGSEIRQLDATINNLTAIVQSLAETKNSELPAAFNIQAD